jgi:hypothetical protein
MSRVSPMAFSWDVLVTAWLLRVRRVTGIPFPFLTDWPIKHVGIRGQHKREFQGCQTPEQRPAHRRLQLVWRSNARRRKQGYVAADVPSASAFAGRSASLTRLRNNAHAVKLAALPRRSRHEPHVARSNYRRPARNGSHG